MTDLVQGRLKYYFKSTGHLKCCFLVKFSSFLVSQQGAKSHETSAVKKESAAHVGRGVQRSNPKQSREKPSIHPRALVQQLA